LFELLKAPSPAVQYEAAGALVGLTSAPTAVRAAAATFIQLLCNVSLYIVPPSFSLSRAQFRSHHSSRVQEADNNVKIVVTDKLDAIRQKYALDASHLVGVHLVRLLVLTSGDG
jgi:hypothetical protein